MLNGFTIRLGEVIAVEEDTRLVSIKWLGAEGKKNKVVLMNGVTDFSFPQVGDRGLILDSDEYSYFLGKLEYDYRGKVAGTVKGLNGDDIIAKVARAGETLIGNTLRNVFLSLTDSGGFSLKSGANEGISYDKPNRILSSIASLVKAMGQGAVVTTGTVFRYVPLLGSLPMPIVGNTPSAGSVPAVEHLIDLSTSGVRFLRAHFGHVKDALGNDEVSSFAVPLRAIIELVTPALRQAAILIDASGNIESTSTLGENHVNGVAVRLGGKSAVQPIIKGTIANQNETNFLNALTSYLGAEATFQGELIAFGAAVATASALSAGAPNMLQNQLAIAGIGTATSILTGAATAYMTAVNNFISSVGTYTGSLPSRLSTKSFTS